MRAFTYGSGVCGFTAARGSGACGGCPGLSSVGDLDTALTSKDGGRHPRLVPVADRDPARLVGAIVQLEEGIDRSAALASVNGRIPFICRVRVERGAANVLDGFALSARRQPGGDRSVAGVSGLPGARGASAMRRRRRGGRSQGFADRGQDPANLSAQLSDATRPGDSEGRGKVVAIIDTVST